MTTCVCPKSKLLLSRPFCGNRDHPVGLARPGVFNFLCQYARSLTCGVLPRSCWRRTSCSRRRSRACAAATVAPQSCSLQTWPPQPTSRTSTPPPPPAHLPSRSRRPRPSPRMLATALPQIRTEPAAAAARPLKRHRARTPAVVPSQRPKASTAKTATSKRGPCRFTPPSAVASPTEGSAEEVPHSCPRKRTETVSQQPRCKHPALTGKGSQ